MTVTITVLDGGNTVYEAELIAPGEELVSPGTANVESLDRVLAACKKAAERA